MLKLNFVTVLIISSLFCFSQAKNTADIKAEIEKSANSPLYVKDVLKKKFKLDTIVVTRTAHFNSLADSLAYTGTLKKVYGPFNMQGQKFLVQILARLPNNFYKISQIYIDSSVFRHRVADSIGKMIITKVRTKQETFQRMSETYSMGGDNGKENPGWVAKGSMLPAVEKQLEKAKKGDVFSVWTDNGLHIIKLDEGPKQDNGFALMMRIFL
jgi:PPIC-type PPIASE domain